MPSLSSLLTLVSLLVLVALLSLGRMLIWGTQASGLGRDAASLQQDTGQVPAPHGKNRLAYQGSEVPARRKGSCSELHDQCELFELFLHAPERASYGCDAGCGGACGVSGDSVAAPGKKGADHLSRLPGVDAGLHQVFA